MSQPSNATVLGVAPLWKTLPAVGVLLVTLFVLMKPESSSGLDFAARAIYWSLHIGLGLTSIGLASQLLRPRFLTRFPLYLSVLITGLAGAAFLAPVYLGLESLWLVGTQQPPDDWLDQLAQQGPWQAVVAEYLEVAPVFVAAWYAVNLPLFFQTVRHHTPPGAAPPPPEERRSHSAAGNNATSDSHTIFNRLPRAIGTDIVAISSDMHYLHVYTALGKCMILGALRDASTELVEVGMLVHRSHWVAHAHVQRLVRKGNQWRCVMSNGLRIPVSRRNRTETLEWYGNQSAVVSIEKRQAGR
jgi:hypothetical protein